MADHWLLLMSHLYGSEEYILNYQTKSDQNSFITNWLEDRTTANQCSRLKCTKLIHFWNPH